jgi:TolA-binding protein
MAAKMSAGRAGINWLVILIVVVALGTGGAFYYIFNQQNQAIQERDGAIQTLQGQVSALSSQVATLQSQVKDTPKEVQSLQGQLNLANQQVRDANTAIDQDRKQIADLKGQVATLQSDNTRLKSITELGESEVKAKNITAHLYKNTVSNVTTFQTGYAGYLVITASNSAEGGYIQVSSTNPNYPFNTQKYVISNSGSTFTIPVLPGTVDITAGNPSTTSEGKVTVSVTYYY